MFTKDMPILLGVILSTLSASALAAGGRGVSAPNPVIVSASQSPNPSQITIRGHAFGSEAPLVFLGEQRLLVKQSGDKEIVAHLPDNLPRATYSLLVVRNKFMRSSPFSLSLMQN